MNTNKKLLLGVVAALALVVIPTYFIYSYLSKIDIFWDSQMIWSTALAILWVVVAIGYYNQGWIVRMKKSSENVSVILPITVFIVQCILFVKGVYYSDWSLTWGALVVNSGVLFSLYHILKYRLKNRI